MDIKYVGERFEASYRLELAKVSEVLLNCGSLDF